MLPSNFSLKVASDDSMMEAQILSMLMATAMRVSYLEIKQVVLLAIDSESYAANSITSQQL